MDPKKNIESTVFTHEAKCRDCYRCVRVCPVNAISMQNSQAKVMGEKCISCGTCIKECPQSAKSYRHDLEKVVDLLDKGEDVAVSIAPSFASVFNEWEQKRLPSALRQAGFKFISETAVGALQVARETRRYAELSSQPCISTSCPVVVNYIEKYMKDTVNNLVPVVSPMIAHGKLLKKKLPGYKVVFIGPCVAKKEESEREDVVGIIDGVITFEQLHDMLKDKNISLSSCEESSFDEEPAGNSCLFPLEGGLFKTAGIDSTSFSFDFITLSGFEEIRDMAELIKNYRQRLLVEPLFCTNGCINGPAMTGRTNYLAKRKEITRYHLSKNYNPGIQADEIDLKTKFTAFNQEKNRVFSEQEIREVLNQTGKALPEQELNCGACGYDSCREKAIAVLQGMAEPEMCMPFMRRMAEQKINLLIDKDPNGILILDRKMEILQINPSFKKLFSCSDAILGKNISYLLDPELFERLSLDKDKVIKEITEYPSYNLVCHFIGYYLEEGEQYVGIFVDITDSTLNKSRLTELKAETVIQAQQLMDHQVKMAQELAKFLGENSAKGEMLMQQLIKAIEK